MICNLPECLVEFSPKNTLQLYCSIPHRKIAASRRKLYTGTCDKCGVVFKHSYRKQKYCSRSCSATVSNKTRIRMGNCKTCEITIPAKLTYCTGCNPKLYVERWLAGLETGSNQDGQLKYRCRQYLLRESGHQCPQCGWGTPNPVTGKPILTINHIDGNWKNNCIENLEVLCYNCHTLTDTFGSLNSKSAGIRGSGHRAYKT